MGARTKKVGRVAGLDWFDKLRPFFFKLVPLSDCLTLREFLYGDVTCRPIVAFDVQREVSDWSRQFEGRGEGVMSQNEGSGYLRASVG